MLATVDDADETKLQRVNTTHEDVECVRSGIHEVKLGENADGAPPLRVNGASELEGVRVGKVYICSRYREDDTSHYGQIPSINRD